MQITMLTNEEMAARINRAYSLLLTSDDLPPEEVPTDEEAKVEVSEIAMSLGLSLMVAVHSIARSLETMAVRSIVAADPVRDAKPEPKGDDPGPLSLTPRVG